MFDEAISAFDKAAAINSSQKSRASSWSAFAALFKQLVNDKKPDLEMYKQGFEAILADDSTFEPAQIQLNVIIANIETSKMNEAKKKAAAAEKAAVDAPEGSDLQKEQ